MNPYKEEIESIMELSPDARLISRCIDNRKNNSDHIQVFRDWVERWFTMVPSKLSQFEYQYLQIRIDEREYQLEKERLDRFQGIPHVLKRAERIQRDEETRQKSHLRIVKTATNDPDPQG